MSLLPQAATPRERRLPACRIRAGETPAPPLRGCFPNLLPALCIFLAGISQLQAQQAERACQTLFFQRPADAPAQIFLHDGQRSRKIELPKLNLSEPYAIAGGDVRLAFTETEVTDPKQIPATAPTAAVPAAWPRVLLLFQSDPAAPGKLRVTPLEVGAERFRPGEMLWFNLTDLALGGQIGKSKLLAHSHSQIVLPAPADQAGDYSVAIDMMEKDSTTGRPVCRTTWQFDPGVRMLVFVAADPGRRAPRVMGIPVPNEAKVRKSARP